METKKNIQKNDRKESGAGLAAGIETENMSQQESDSVQNAKEKAMKAAIDEAIKRATEPLVKAAGEPVDIAVEIRDDGATFIIFGSEIACLRLAFSCKNTKGAPKVRFMSEINRWCIVIDVCAEDAKKNQRINNNQ